MENKLSKEEITKTLCFINLGLSLCLNTTKNDKVRVNDYMDNIYPKLLTILFRESDGEGQE